MNVRRNFILNSMWIVFGASLIAATKLAGLDDIFLGFGGGLLGVGIIQLIRTIKYTRNREFRENYDIAVKDERNNYIRLKAWAWAGYLFVITCALITIAAMCMSKSFIMQASSYAICLILIFYWISYIIIRKKN